MSEKTLVTLVLLPGMDGTGQMFQPLISELGKGIVTSVVRYPESEPLGYQELFSVVQSALRPIDGPYVILGESFSGPLAIKIAASRPQGMRGLILCCTFARNPHPALRHLRSAINVLPFNSIVANIGAHALFGRFSTNALRGIFQQAVSR